MRVCKADHWGVCICSELTVKAELGFQIRGSALLFLGPIHTGAGFCFNERIGYRCAAKIRNHSQQTYQPSWGEAEASRMSLVVFSSWSKGYGVSEIGKKIKMFFWMEVIGKQDQHELPFLGRVGEADWTLTRTDVRLATTQFKRNLSITVTVPEVRYFYWLIIVNF